MSDALAKAVDWELAKSLFVAGTKRAIICAKAGCTPTALDRRITREKWVEVRARFNEHSLPETISIAKRGELVQQLIATEVHSQVANLSKTPNPRDLEQQLTKASTLGKLTDVSKEVFGAMAQPRLLINIAVMEQARTVETPADTRDLEIVQHLGNGYTKITVNGVSRIVDERHTMPHPHLYANCKPPQIIDVPGRTALAETNPENDAAA
jgi:hypothetical protein